MTVGLVGIRVPLAVPVSYKGCQHWHSQWHPQSLAVTEGSGRLETGWKPAPPWSFNDKDGGERWFIQLVHDRDPAAYTIAFGNCCDRPVSAG